MNKLLFSLLFISSATFAIPEMPHPEVFSLNNLNPFSQLESNIEVPFDPEFSRQWWYHNIGQKSSNGISGVVGADTSMLEALEVYDPKEEVIIAVIDSGFDPDHEDFDNSTLWVNEVERDGLPGVDDDGNGYIDDVHGHNMVLKNNDFTDRKQHGTHVSGLISAISNNDKGIFGSVSGIKIMMIKLWDIGGDIHKTPTAEAIRYACANGAKIISNSYGTPSYGEDTKEAIEYCLEKGALFVSASGNFSKNLDLEPDYPSSFGVANQIVVGASTNYDGRATFSNYGNVVNMFAPGEDIYSLRPGNRYRSTSGTSQACPLVSLAAAMTLAHNPELSVFELKERVLNGGDQRSSLVLWSQNGIRLNTYNALLGVRGERTPEFDLSQFKSSSLNIETAHPYPKRKTLVQEFNMEGIKRFRLHFSKFDVYSYDRVVLEDRDGKILEVLTGKQGEFWSPVYEGDYLKLTLTSKSGPIRFGYAIDQVEFE